jgi:serine protease Do
MSGFLITVYLYSIVLDLARLVEAFNPQDPTAIDRYQTNAIRRESHSDQGHFWMKKNLYSILGVDANASPGAIDSAYRALMTQIDPAETVQRMAAKEAWSTLGHPQRRAAYDASLHEAPRRRATPVAQAAEPSSFGKAPMVGSLALLILLGGWFALRPSKHAPVTVSASRQLPNGSGAGMPAPSATSTSSGKVLSPEALFAQASASVVRVNVLDATGEATGGMGSGVVVERGVVITNCHVAKPGAGEKVKYRTEQYEASLIMADEGHDLCKLSVLGLPAPPVTLRKLDTLHVGQKVYAIGSPQGLDLTLSDGMVSSLRQGADGTYIQTSAPISPGSSGGGLFTEDGQLVGIVTFQLRAGQNLNFAIPADWITSMSTTAATTTAPSDEDDYFSSVKAQESMRKAILGTWHCFGGTAVRNFDPVFESDGSISGNADGQSLDGRWALRGKQLTMGSTDSVSFEIEELTPTRMVLNRGAGRRMTCGR